MQQAFRIASATWRPHGDGAPYEVLPILRGMLHIRPDAKPAEAVIILAPGPHVAALVWLWKRDEMVDVRLVLDGEIVDDQEMVAVLPELRHGSPPRLVLQGDTALTRQLSGQG